MAACSSIAMRTYQANWSLRAHTKSRRSHNGNAGFLHTLVATPRRADGSCRHLGRGEDASARFSARQGLHKGVEEVPLDGSAIVGSDNEAVTPTKGATRHGH
jgi:hypothetical protein